MKKGGKGMANTGKVCGRCYLDKNEILLSQKSGSMVTGQITFRLDQKMGKEYFKTSDNKFIV